MSIVGHAGSKSPGARVSKTALARRSSIRSTASRALFDRAEDLTQFRVFRGLSDKQLQIILPLLSVQQVEIGDVEIGDVDRNVRFALIASGQHRATIMSPSGEHITIRALRAGDHFGEFAVLSGVSQSYYHLISDAPGTLLFMAGEDLLRLIDDLPALRHNIVSNMAREALISADRIFEFAALNGKVRLSAELLRLRMGGIERNGIVTIAPAPTHEAIASQIGATREGVTRYFKALAQQGLVRHRRGLIEILDQTRLRAVVERDAGKLMSYERQKRR